MKYFIVAWLPGQDNSKRVVMRLGTRNTVQFDTWQEAQDWCVEFLTPDWEWLIIPMKIVEIDSDAEISLNVNKGGQWKMHT